MYAVKWPSFGTLSDLIWEDSLGFLKFVLCLNLRIYQQVCVIVLDIDIDRLY